MMADISRSCRRRSTSRSNALPARRGRWICWMNNQECASWSAQRGNPRSCSTKSRLFRWEKGWRASRQSAVAPVQVCNLQYGQFGGGEPGARDTKMEGSVAAPMLMLRASSKALSAWQSRCRTILPRRMPSSLRPAG